MGVTTFDTLKFVRRLEEVGVPSEQAEVQAEVLTEAFRVNLEELVTKEYLTAEFAKQNARIETKMAERFAEQQTYMDKRFADGFAEQRIYMDKRFANGFAEINTKIENRLSEERAHTEQQFTDLRVELEKRFSKQDVKFGVLFWMVSVVILAVVAPYIERIIQL